jgi:type IV pilus assembly protein PilY1
MKIRQAWKPHLSRLSLAVSAAMCVAVSAHAYNELNIAPEPLPNATTSVRANIMFILDDSGSMGWDFMPDYIDDMHNPTGTPPTTAGCYDAGDDGGGITGAPDPCILGDPPFSSADFNSMYYNPDIYYRPGANYDGTDMLIQDAASTANWTAVQVNPYTTAATTNLAAQYPDRVWCMNQADAATGGNCRQNTSYRYPDAVFPYGETGGGAIKYVNGAPYYYRMQTARFCTDAARTTCVSGSAVVPGTHTFLAPEFCTDKELSNCTAGASVTAAHLFYGVRWCNNTGLQEDTIPPIVNKCQRKKIGAFIYAKHLGTTTSQTGTFLAVPNEGNINVTSVLGNAGNIQSITIGGVSVISGPIAVPTSSNPSAVAAQITTAIQSYVSSPDFVASQSGANVTVQRAVAGATGSGAAIAIVVDQIGTTSSIGRLTVGTGADNRNQDIITLAVNAVNLLCPIAVSDASYGSNVSVVAPDGRIRAANGTNAAAERNAFRLALRNRINACAINGYTASISGGDVLIIAPVSQGATPNGLAVTRTGAGPGSLANFTAGAMGSVQAGVSSGIVTLTNSNMTGGQDPFTGTRAVRIGYGLFSRTDIVPANNAYPKGAGRIDCAAVTCTYVEEMTNFASWYAYYRTRIQMMKTAVGRAFLPVDDAYRVGFITINPGATVAAAKYLRMADFTTVAGGHKQAWYSKLYSQNVGSSTPLREALSRVGWMYAGKMNTGLTSGIPAADDPLIASCQPNFAILSTDGYWNGSAGQTLSGAAIGNQDNVNSGYSTQQTGAFDGGTPTASDTLADVAMYYYKNDLRTTGTYATDNVPTTSRDGASHQHMVTFTLGLGLDGQLSYRPDYDTADTGDFVLIKEGSIKWPVPVADAPSALDDLWHAAVNGRGVFFSAKNPDELANGLSETLKSLQARIGAGAAAATSNLQPVSGDNFAFIAQYQTSDWIGDVTARTIDLSSGIISNIILWSGAFTLDQTAYTSRNIYTYDATDTAGNRLKNFCWPGGGTGCADGTGLDATEQGYFNPSLLPQWTTWNVLQRASASGQNLVNYLRGDASFVNSGQLLATDLYRERLGLLGDIISAQPQYLRGATFAYTDRGYSEFKDCLHGTPASGVICPAARFPDPSKPRRGTVYAAANDGMLHAFETDLTNTPTSAYYQTAGVATDITADDAFTGISTGNGTERWAYIPGLVLPELFRLASNPYNHRYYTDGTPGIGDICISTPCAGLDDWRTLLVAGLNGGGSGYYALDVTNALAPKAMWEFKHSTTCLSDTEANSGSFNSDCNVGLSYGNPMIVKRKSDGKWVVIVSSGYNNNVGGGDGQGYLYILDAVTGNIIRRIATGSGTALSPSGLAKITGWVTNSNVDNTVLAVYAGDLDGNMWRFDLDSTSGGYNGVVKLAQAVDLAGVPQPITIKPSLGEVNVNNVLYRVVLFGTGKFIEDADKTDTTTKNTVYALRDTLSVTSGTVIPSVLDSAKVIRRQFTAGVLATERKVVAATGPKWDTDSGWRIELPDTGERVNVDGKLQLGTYFVASNVPNNDTCTSGGYSYLNSLDYRDGSEVSSATNAAASVKITSALTAGISVIMLPGGKVSVVVTKTGVGGGTTGGGGGTGGGGTGSVGPKLTESPPGPTEPVIFTGRRVSWRELIKDQ